VKVERAVVEAWSGHALAAAGARVLVACSGGPDSMVLLDVLARLASRFEIVVAVASVDHGLREAAKDEVKLVERAARARGLEFVTRALEGIAPTPAAARAARYAALVECAREVGASVIAVAHTATDQAETLLDRMIRGAGTRGLSAMAPKRMIDERIALVRPLLDVTRDEIEAYVEARGLEVVRDPSNASLERRRGRMRHEILPLLKRERADVERALAELAARLRDDEVVLGALADKAACECATTDGGLDVVKLRALPRAIAVRVLARFIDAPLESVHFDAVLELCGTADGTRSIDVPGRRVERRYGQLHLDQSFDGNAYGNGSGNGNDDGGDVYVRTRRPGDRVLLANGKHRKLSDVLIDAKVPRGERDRVPLLVRRGPAGEVVVWCGLTLTHT
jgi:tRNA(Ile)-lysidine synthase